MTLEHACSRLSNDNVESRQRLELQETDPVYSFFAPYLLVAYLFLFSACFLTS